MYEKETTANNVYKGECNHHFTYSHQEQPRYPVSTKTEQPIVDVVICTKCGLIKRT